MIEAKDKVIRLGSYYLQGWIGWGPKSAATPFTEKEANKVIEKLAKCGYKGKVVPLVYPSRRRSA